MANITNNIFYFDLDDTAAFLVIKGCAYACGASSVPTAKKGAPDEHRSTSFTQFQNFQGNLYWRTDGGFSTDGKAFHVNRSEPQQCEPVSQHPVCLYVLRHSEWQRSSGSPPPGSQWGPSGGMNEDTAGTVTTNPIFGATGDKTDSCCRQALP